MAHFILFVIALFAGLLLGFAAVFFLKLAHRKTAKELVDEMKEIFGNLSFEAWEKLTDLAKSKLESEREIHAGMLDNKKGLIDQQLGNMVSQLEKVATLVKDLEKDREGKFKELAAHLKTTNDRTTELTQTANTLREALASTKARGQWGERMAEDVLRLAGFIENVNYVKQKVIEGAGSKPDFTFLLPQNLRLNMDVKFPWDNYVRFLDARAESDKEKLKADFLRDVKARIKEVTTREYINTGQNTVDCVLLFIPNEQVYGFIHEQDSSIFDDGIKNKVIFCSPITLFAVLAVIRQAVDNFSLSQTSNEILSLFGAFKKQWDEFIVKFQSLGKRIDDAHTEYDALSTTRRRKLEKPLKKIDDLRKQRGLPVSADEDEETSALLEELKKDNGQ